MRVSKTHFLAIRQKPKHLLPLESRQDLFMIPSLEEFCVSNKDRKRIMLMAARRSVPTLKGWNRSINRVKKFLHDRDLEFRDLSESLLLDYIFSLEDERASFSMVSGQQAAIKFALQALKLRRSIWSQERINSRLIIV